MEAVKKEASARKTSREEGEGQGWGFGVGGCLSHVVDGAGPQKQAKTGERHTVVAGWSCSIFFPPPPQSWKKAQRCLKLLRRQTRTPSALWPW